MGPQFKPFSPKQLAVLSWWCESSPVRDLDGVICDGAVRSGKTLCMSLSFVLWAFHSFEDTTFALCGKTIQSLRRNLVTPLIPALQSLGFSCREVLSRNLLEVRRDGKMNRFCLFGAVDERASALIQGVTLGGVLLDEAALMPRSFVEQALARCSLDGSKFWFNCNPEHPYHWFYTEWIQKAQEKHILYLHFRLEDNPALSGEVVARYRSLYSGAFYERFIEGKWTAPQGLVYPMFDPAVHVRRPPDCTAYYLSCDYGTRNPFSLGLWGLWEGSWYRLQEYYHDARALGVQHTDEEYYEALLELAGEREITALIVDPSASSFIQCVKRHGRYRTIPAQNDVLPGIRRVCDALRQGQIYIAPSCRDTLREFTLYRWDSRSHKDAPRKEFDHAMDDIRYFVSHIRQEDDGGFYSIAVERK
ncbi:MAG: PBSX family phage terminase large subunit [Clostridiales bacterium]|nr:PBSX family phage terminase large subunit [Clostridiales bacterium]